MKKKYFILIICIVIFLIIFTVISCSKKLNPFIPNNGSSENIGGGEVTSPIVPPIEYPNDENEPEWFLDPEDQIIPFMEQTVIFKSEAGPEIVNGAPKPKKIYRIPGITVSENNTIIAVADNRKDSYKDVGFTGSKAIDIVVRRSTDGGKTWDPEIIIPPIATSANDAHGDSLFFSCANGDLVVLCAAEGGYAHQNGGKSKIMISRSTDDGITWSDWKDAQGDINNFNSGKLQGYDRGFAASGTGARLNDDFGTLMGAMLVNNSSMQANSAAAAVIVSTDNGYTWTVRSVAKRTTGTKEQDEPKVVTQLNDGRILLSVRSGNWKTTVKKRVWFRSQANLGSAWDELTPIGNFFDGACNAEGILFTSVLDGYDKNRLIHLALDSDSATRQNLTAFISYDEGESWEKQKVLNSGRAGYAALARLEDGTIVTLSEEQNGQDLPETSNELYNIVFRRFNLRWLTEQKDFYTPPNQALRRR